MRFLPPGTLLVIPILVFVSINVAHTQGSLVILHAPFNSAGLLGNVTFIQDDTTGNVTISIHLYTAAGRNDTARHYAWGIYNYPVLYDTSTPCASNELGRSIHDLSKTHGQILIPSKTIQEYNDTEIQLRGVRTIWGKSLLLRSMEAGDDFRACANIVDSGGVKTVEATFRAPIAGTVIFRENERGETIIFSNLFHTAEDYLPSSNHEWKILVTDILETRTRGGELRRCEHLQVLYDPLNRDETNCSRSKQLSCKIGDLTKKHGLVVVGATNSRYSKKFFVDVNLPLNSLENQRSLYLVLYEKDNPLRIMGCAKMNAIKPKEVKANFNSQGVKGYILFSQRYRMDPTVVTVNLKHLRNRGSSYHIHEFPLPSRISKDDELCSEESIGDLYNPFNVDSNKTIPKGKGTTDQYEVGNLSGKYGTLGEITLLDFHFGIYADFNLPLFGINSIIGRSIGIYQKNGSRWICANIGYPTEVRTGIATFYYPIIGRVIFRQEEGNPWGDTTVFGELSYGDGTVNNTDNHRFDIHVNEPGRDFYNWTRRCDSAGGDFNPYYVGLGRQYERYCVPDNPFRCRVGDLTGKFRRISIARSPKAIKNKFFYTDITLALNGPHKILGKSLVVHDDTAPPHRGDRLACTGIRIYHPVRVTVKKWTSHSKDANVSGILSLSQDFETDITLGRFEVMGLLSLASGYHIHELSVPQGKYFPCTEDAVRNHFNPFAVNTSLGPAPGVGSNDQYEVGDLSGKFGLLDEKESERLTFEDVNLPLHGLHSVVGRSILIHKKERNFRWVCGTLHPEYNRDVAREVVAIASFHDPRSFIQGYVRLRQLEYADGGRSDTWIEVDLRYPGKHNSKRTHHHAWAVYVSQVSHDAFEKVDNVRCIGAGFRWNPYLIKSDDKLYTSNCHRGNPFRCEMGDMTGKHGPLEIGGFRRVLTDVNLPLVGNYSVVGRSLVIFKKDFSEIPISCANIQLDIHLVSHVTVQIHPGFTSGKFMDHMRGLLNTTDWLVIEEIESQKEIIKGHCVQLKIHFYGPEAHRLQIEFSNLINLGSVSRETRFGSQIVETYYRSCKMMKDVNSTPGTASLLLAILGIMLIRWSFERHLVQ